VGRGTHHDPVSTEKIDTEEVFARKSQAQRSPMNAPCWRGKHHAALACLTLRARAIGARASDRCAGAAGDSVPLDQIDSFASDLVR